MANKKSKEPSRVNTFKSIAALDMKNRFKSKEIANDRSNRRAKDTRNNEVVSELESLMMEHNPMFDYKSDKSSPNFKSALKISGTKFTINFEDFEDFVLSMTNHSYSVFEQENTKPNNKVLTYQVTGEPPLDGYASWDKFVETGKSCSVQTILDGACGEGLINPGTYDIVVSW